ncbi:MAG: RNA polymerase sigma-70 factor [Tannerellaceae bacterium]|jgi:RNA polymerase sigma-70 factor (ECF subfamily)|nr:RNA polymerase sigma-70 factor [Tannerellaceae bacterium]
MTDRSFAIPDALFRKISQGDRKSFRVFYDIAYPFIYQFAHYFLPSKSDCEEVVSEVFYIIWKQRESLPAVNYLKSWLYTICRNEAFRYLKQRENYRNISIDDLPVELLVDASAIESKLIEEEMLDVYNTAVSELPERCKLIFLMVREQRLKYKEIARILSITEGTVEQQMNIAIRKIVSAVHAYYPFINPPKANKR